MVTGTGSTALDYDQVRRRLDYSGFDANDPDPTMFGGH